MRTAVSGKKSSLREGEEQAQGRRRAASGKEKSSFR
jgi:hypothetical protein